MCGPMLAFSLEHTVFFFFQIIKYTLVGSALHSTPVLYLPCVLEFERHMSVEKAQEANNVATEIN